MKPFNGVQPPLWLIELGWTPDGYLEPKSELDQPIFEHLTNGLSSITFGHYQDVVDQVARLHGICLQVEDKANAE